MNTDKFLELCTNAVVAQYNADIKHLTFITKENVYVVWNCKTLQNNKALLSTTVNGDGMHYECTYNGDKQELYLDAYKKQENQCIKVED